ncbi:MAG: DUF4389 domain-containing protein [Flavobacteriales bacterium]|nr:DUF4389 domain-containing protein [Flavobacteriales bacterium]
MKYGVRHQESYSRGELLLRTFLGVFYIAIPHAFILIFLLIWSSLLNFVTFWTILITGQFPESMFNYQLNLQRWALRVNVRMQNLSDGYPAFGLASTDANIMIEIERPEKSNRGTVFLRAMFGFLYVMIPHVFCLVFLMIGASFVRFIAFWAVLITGKYPKGMHDYMVGLLRWQFRISAYMGYMTDVYPPFSLKGDEADFGNSSSSDLLDN